MKNNYLNKRVVVTGASGFIGSRLIDRLNELGAKVHALSRKHNSEDKNNIHWHNADLTNYKKTEQIVLSTNPNYIFHLASEVTGKRDLDMVLPTLSNNLISSVHILTAATKAHCEKVVLAGSLEEPEYTNSLQVPASPYAAAKWASAGYARMFKELYSTPAITAKIFMVYGPGQSDLNKLVPYVILSLLRGNVPKLMSGNRPVDWIFVDDVIEGLLIAATSKNSDRKSFDIGSGNLITVREIVETIIDLLNSTITPEFGALPDRLMEQVRVANFDSQNKYPEWAPKYSLKEGLKITIAWYQEQYELGLIC